MRDDDGIYMRLRCWHPAPPKKYYVCILGKRVGEFIWNADSGQWDLRMYEEQADAP